MKRDYTMYTAHFHTLTKTPMGVKFPIIHEELIKDVLILKDIESNKFLYSSVYMPETGKQGYFANKNTSAIEFADGMKKYSGMPIYWISENAILIDGIELDQQEEKVLMSLWKTLPDEKKINFLQSMRTNIINVRFFRSEDGIIFATYVKNIFRKKTMYASWVPIVF